MKSHPSSSRLLLLAGLLLALASGGCGKQQVPKPQAIALAPVDNPAPRPVPQPQAPAVPMPPAPPPEVPVKPAAEVKPDVPLTEAERLEYATYLEWLQVKPWEWENDPMMKRQRPVYVLGLLPHGLDGSIPMALKFAGGLVNVGWDVKVLLHLTGADRRDMTALKAVKEEIDRINVEIENRNRDEAPNLLPDVAPLKAIDAPVTFKTAEELKTSLDLWLSKSFLGPTNPMLAQPFSRPPFGLISFLGHGKSVLKDQEGPANASNAVFKVEVAKNDLFDLSLLGARVLQKYQAPVWLIPDICRDRLSENLPDAEKVRGNVEKFQPRDFENLADLGGAGDMIVECEKLRSNASPGLLHRNKLGMTTLSPTSKLHTVNYDAKQQLHNVLGTLLERPIPMGDKKEVRFKDVPGQPTSITLSQVTSWACRRTPKEKPTPHLSKGAVSDQVVVFSWLRGKDTYQQLYPNLLTVPFGKLPGGFAVPELDNAKVPEAGEHSGPVTLTRQQPDFDSDFKSIFKFDQPLDLHTSERYQLVLGVSASGGAPGDSIKFTTGVYQNSNRPLNTSFSRYDLAESYTKPIKCDGTLRYIHVPLDVFNDAAAKQLPVTANIAKFEIQAVPHTTPASWNQVGSHWKQGLSLHLHAVYLTPLWAKDEDLKLDFEPGNAKSRLDQMLTWGVPLHAELHAKPDAVDVVQDKSTDLKQKTLGFKGLWGAVGEVYPKLFAESDKQQIRVRLEVPDGTEIADAAVVCVYLCSDKSVLAVWQKPLKDAVKQDHVFPLTASGVMQEVVVAVKGHAGTVNLIRLAVEAKPGGR